LRCSTGAGVGDGLTGTDELALGDALGDIEALAVVDGEGDAEAATSTVDCACTETRTVPRANGKVPPTRLKAFDSVNLVKG
jgi:hypothetical protein